MSVTDDDRKWVLAVATRSDLEVSNGIRDALLRSRCHATNRSRSDAIDVCQAPRHGVNV